MTAKEKTFAVQDTSSSSDEDELKSSQNAEPIGLPSSSFRQSKKDRLDWENHFLATIKIALEPWDNKQGKPFENAEKIDFMEAAFRVFPGIIEYTKDPKVGFKVLTSFDLEYTTEEEKKYNKERVTCLQNVLLKTIISRIIFKGPPPETLKELIDYYENLWKHMAPQLVFNYFERIIGSYISLDEPRLLAADRMLNSFRLPGRFDINQGIAKLCSQINGLVLIQFHALYRFKPAALRYCRFISDQFDSVKKGKPFDHDRLTNNLNEDTMIDNLATERHREDLARMNNNNNTNSSNTQQVNAIYNNNNYDNNRNNNYNNNYRNNNANNNNNNNNKKNKKKKNNNKGKVSKPNNKPDNKALTLEIVKTVKELLQQQKEYIWSDDETTFDSYNLLNFLFNINSQALQSDFVDYEPMSLKYDSGALRTVVGNKKLLTNYDSEELQLFELPNGHKIRSHGSGDLVIKVNHHELILKDAHYIPGFKINLVSCGQITAQGYDVILSHRMLLCVKFNEKDVIFAKQSRDTNLFTGPSSGIIYSNGKMYMNDNALTEYEDEEESYLNSINAMTKLVDPRIDQVVANPDSRKDLYYYHLITGHMSIRALIRLHEQGKIKCSIDDQDAKDQIKGCKQCIIVNAKQHSHNKTTQSPPERSLYRFHCDTMGPYHVGHVKYYITLLTDHYSGFSFAIIKTEKRFTKEILDLFEHLHADLYPKRISRFRSDNAKEFPTEAELGSLKIKKEVLPPYSPEMNGMAESHNNILKKRMLYVILNFPNRYKELLIFFCEIVAYAVFIKNHTPSERTETRKGWTPHELFYNRRYKPNYHQFGVDVFVTVLNKQEADALGVQYVKGFHKSVPGIFLGYGNDSNVYLIQLVDGNYTRRLFVNVRFLGTMNNINTFLETYGIKMRKNMEENGKLPFFEDSSRNELRNGLYVPHEGHFPVEGTSSQHVSSDKPTTINPINKDINMDELIAEVPDDFLQDNMAGDFLTQQGFTFPLLQVTGELLEHQSNQSFAPYNWMNTDTIEYLKMGSDHKYLEQKDTAIVETNNQKQFNDSEPSFQNSRTNKSTELDHGVLPTAEGIRHGVPNAWGETAQDGSLSSNIDVNQPFTTIPTHRPPPPVGDNVQFLRANNDSGTLLPSEWGLPPQKHLSNGGAYESLPVSNVTTSVRLSDSTMNIDVGDNRNIKRRKIDRQYLLPNKDIVNEISVRIQALKNEHNLNKTIDNSADSYLFTRTSTLENKDLAYYDGIGRVSKPPMLLNNLKIIDELIPPTKYISSIESSLDALESDLNDINDDIDLSVYGVEKYVDLNDENWKRSMEKEMQKFKDMNVYQLVKKKKNFRLIPAKWVHTYKPNDPKGEYFKSRCVVQGFRQIAGLEFDKNRVLSPVTDLSTIRVLTAIAVENEAQIHHIDIKSAYLNATLPKDTPIFVRPPPGYDDGVHCWRLVKAVYGLKQSGFEWHSHVTNTFKKMGLAQCDNVEGLFMLKKGNGNIYIALYVDDLFVVASTNKLFNEFMDDLEAKFSLNYIGEILEYLGIQFQKTSTGYELHQNKFVKRLIEAFPTEIMKGADLPRTPDNGFAIGKHIIIDDKTGKPAKNQKDIPISDEYIFENIDSPRLDKEHHDLYRSIVGMLLWLTMNTMPSISYSTNALAAKCHEPTENDYKHLMQMIKYLYKNNNERLIMRRNQTKNISEDSNVIYAYSDASFAADLDRHSVSGFAIYLNGNLVSWGTKRQRSITKSSMACELIALGETVDRSMIIRQIVESMGYSAPRIIIFEDNQPVIMNSYNRKSSAIRRLVDICLKTIRQLILEYKILSVVYINTKLNVADLLTKAVNNNTMKTLKPLLYDKGNLKGVEKLIKDNFDSPKPVEEDKHSLLNNLMSQTEEMMESYYVISSIVSSEVESRNINNPKISGDIALIRD